MIVCDGSDEIVTDEEREAAEAADAAREEAALLEMFETWPRWAARLHVEMATMVNPNAWRESLDFYLSLPGANDNLSAWTLDGPLWARRVLEAVS